MGKSRTGLAPEIFEGDSAKLVSFLFLELDCRLESATMVLASDPTVDLEWGDGPFSHFPLSKVRCSSKQPSMFD